MMNRAAGTTIFILIGLLIGSVFIIDRDQRQCLLLNDTHKKYECGLTYNIALTSSYAFRVIQNTENPEEDIKYFAEHARYYYKAS